VARPAPRVAPPATSVSRAASPAATAGIGAALTQLARSTQAAPTTTGGLTVGAGCGISTMCPRGFPPPRQSVMSGFVDARMGL
jgi:hypothetical protein